MTDFVAPEPFTIQLSPRQQLVLFEFLSRCVRDGVWNVEATAEWDVLSSLLGDLETRLAEPFRPDYGVLLEEARSALRPDDLTLADIIKP